jgi:DNA polymerase-4
MGLFAEQETAPPDPRREKLERTMDALRQKYGQTAVAAGSLLGNDLGLEDFHKKD